MITNTSVLKVGDKVHYKPSHFPLNGFENGIVKEIRSHILHKVWVVYNCAGNWEDYKEYTGCATSLNDLNIGWINED